MFFTIPGGNSPVAGVSASAELMARRNNDVHRTVFITNTITAGWVQLFLEVKAAPSVSTGKVREWHGKFHLMGGE
jgi:hypothetical protein